MDFDRGTLRPILAASALLLCGGADAPALLLREQAWTPAGETLTHDLTHSAGECLAFRSEPIEIGRALFRSPALLGGPAARAGLSCHACHSDGSINTRFLLPELTDRAGHADVTSEWASETRGDGVANPVPIPDLAGSGGRTAFGRGQLPLDGFVRTVIEEEFQGPPPPQQAFEGVLAYLRALQLSECPSGPTPVTLASAANDVRRALAAALSADDATASLLLLSAQDAVGRIVERLPPHRFGGERRRLEVLARELGAMRGRDFAGDAPAWRARFDGLVSRLARRERHTYFNAATLGAALAR